MNKVYKVIWSKAKNCYVVTSELAKSHTKAPAGRGVSRSLVAGVLACVLGTGVALPVYAVNPAPANANYVVYDDGTGLVITLEGALGTGTKITNLAEGEVTASSTDAVTGSQLYYMQQVIDQLDDSLLSNNTAIARAQTDINNIKTANATLRSTVNTLNTEVDTGFNVTANGALVKTVNPSSNFINFKGGDGISVANDGGALKISVDGDGVIASGDTGAVTGGVAYTELRPATGNYVSQTNTTATNLTALDTQVKANADAIAQEVTDRGTAITNEATARQNADTELSDRIDALDGNTVQYDDATKAKVTLEGTNGTILDNVFLLFNNFNIKSYLLISYRSDNK